MSAHADDPGPLPAGGQSAKSIPLLAAGVVAVAAAIVAAARGQWLLFALALAAAAFIAAALARARPRPDDEAQQQLERSLERLSRTDEQRRRLLAHVVKVQEDERQRVAADIHDDSVQAMAAVGLRLAMIRRRLEDDELRAQFEIVEDSVRESLRRLRNLMFDLRPPALDTAGLVATLEMQLEKLREEAGIEYSFHNELDAEPGSDTRVLIYRIAREALTNVRKHARTERVDVRLAAHESGILLRVSDEGAGFEPDDANALRGGHLGLLGIRERAEMTGGWARVDSRLGGGTTVEAWLPTDERAADVAGGR